MNWPFAALEPGAYAGVVADPPWAFRVRSNRGLGRSAEHHYRTMTLDDIAALPVGDLAARDAWLFMWITGPCLVEGQHLPLMEAWGFRPSALGFVWLKAKRAALSGDLFYRLDDASFHVGLGHTTRQNAEYIVLGRRGEPKRASKAVRQIIVAERREHSRKPEEARDRIEAYVGPGKRIAELFARESRAGWDCWGNELGKFARPE